MKRNTLLAIFSLFSLLAISLPASADEPIKPAASPVAKRPPMDDAKRQEIFQKIKDRQATRIDDQIKLLQAEQSCIRAASSFDAMKSCRQKNKEEKKQLHEKWRSEREAMKAQRGKDKQ